MIEEINMSAYSIPGFIIRDEISTDAVISSVCDYFDITETELKNKSRKPDIIFPRFIAMYLLSVECKLSLYGVAKKLGKRDHTTIMNAKKRINGFILINDEKTISALKAIRISIKIK